MKNWTIEKDGTTIDCVSFGKGGKALVVVPGLSFQRVKGSGPFLAYMYRAFRKDYTVYVIDKKDAVPAGYTIEEMAEDAVFAMERMGIRTADVWGVSQGGMIAQYMAIGHPGLVRRLVLAVTAARQNDVMKEVLTGWLDMAERGDFEAIIKDMLPKMYSAAYVKKYGWLFPLLAKAGSPKDLRRFTALARACFTCDAYPQLHKIACPVFVIGGKEDRVVTAAASQEIAQKLSCEIYLYEKLGHGAYEEAPDFNKRVLRFLLQEKQQEK